MTDFSLSYSVFKDLADRKKGFWQCVDLGNRYEVFLLDAGIKYTTTVWRDTAGVGGLDAAAEAIVLNDFETTYKDGCNRADSIAPTAAQTQFYGASISLASGDTEGFHEWTFGSDVYINKVLPIPIEAVFGDTVDFEVWAKGETPQKVGQYAYNIPLIGTANMPWFYGSGGGLIPATCNVRVYYHKAAGVARNFNVVAEFLI